MYLHFDEINDFTEKLTKLLSFDTQYYNFFFHLGEKFCWFIFEGLNGSFQVYGDNLSVVVIYSIHRLCDIYFPSSCLFHIS